MLLPTWGLFCLWKTAGVAWLFEGKWSALPFVQHNTHLNMSKIPAIIQMLLKPNLKCFIRRGVDGNSRPLMDTHQYLIRSLGLTRKLDSRYWKCFQRSDVAQCQSLRKLRFAASPSWGGRRGWICNTNLWGHQSISAKELLRSVLISCESGLPQSTHQIPIPSPWPTL